MQIAGKFRINQEGQRQLNIKELNKKVFPSKNLEDRRPFHKDL